MSNEKIEEIMVMDQGIIEEMERRQLVWYGHVRG